ncbi:MAG: hypothetical protein ACE5JS_17180 [Nitrospinota bacterium]
MAKKLGILVIHGMGNQGPDFAEPMIEELHGRIFGNAIDRDDSEVAWESAHWAKEIQDAQNGLWKDLSKDSRMSFTKLRQFVVSNLGDAIAYQRVPSQSGERISYYDKFHRAIHQSLVALREKLGNEDKPLIVIAHSLGSTMMSNYIWDRQKRKKPVKFNKTPFERMESMAGFITFGSTIPLFALAYRKRENFTFPPPRIATYFPNANEDQVKKAVKWLNFFDADDILGYPIRPLGPGYKMVQDIEINVGGILSSWNPLSHTQYWTDNDFTKPVSETIENILNS